MKKQNVLYMWYLWFQEESQTYKLSNISYPLMTLGFPCLKNDKGYD